MYGANITFKNNKYTTSITFEFTVSRDNKQFNIFDRHKKIFEAIYFILFCFALLYFALFALLYFALFALL